MKRGQIGVLGGVFTAIFLIVLPLHTYAASFYLSPASGSYKVGDTITASVMIDSAGQAINAGDASVAFSTDQLDYSSFSTSGSIFSFWTTGPSGSNTGVNFSGGLSNPGYTGSSGKVLSISWKAKAPGLASVNVNGSKILANDGQGTNLYTKSSGGTFTVTEAGAAAPAPAAKPKAPGAPTVTSSTHPDPNKWFNAKTVKLKWSAAGVKGYIFTFDASPSTDPTGSVSSTTETQYENGDGIWYFHVKGKTDTGFTPITHFRVQVDTTPPEDFGVSVSGDGKSSNPAPTASFSAKDTLSGIDHYEVKIDDGEWKAIASGDRLPKQKPGDHTVIIRATDRAGNARESTTHYTIIGINPPTILSWDKSIALLTPVHFIGRSKADDTIYVYVNSKEVDHFLAKDKQVAESDPAYAEFGGKGAKDEIEWEYIYTNPLYPGNQSFRFSRTDKDGAESALTNPYVVSVNASTITIGGRVIPTKYLIIFMLNIILLLLVLILYLWSRIRYLAALCMVPIAVFARRSRKLLGKLEGELKSEVETDIPDQTMSKEQVELAKLKLKDDIHELTSSLAALPPRGRAAILKFKLIFFLIVV